MRLRLYLNNRGLGLLVPSSYLAPRGHLPTVHLASENRSICISYSYSFYILLQIIHVMVTMKPPEFIALVHTATHSNDEKANPGSQSRRDWWWRRLNRFWIDGWAPEIASCSIALSSLVFLIAILSLYQNKVLEDLPIRLSINTVVSILASILKASLVMPVAECKIPQIIVPNSSF